MVSICDCSQTHTAHSPRGWQETANGSSPFSRLSVKAVVRQAWKWFLQWVVCCLVAYWLVEFISKALDLGLVKSVSLLFFRLFLKFVCVHHVLFVEEWYIEKHISGISVSTNCVPSRSASLLGVVSWVGFTGRSLRWRFRCPWDTGCGEAGKGGERKEVRVGFRLESYCSLICAPAQELWGMSYRTESVLPWDQGVVSRDLLSVTRSDWGGWEGPRQFSGEGGSCELAASAHSSWGGACPVPGKETWHQ